AQLVFNGGTYNISGTTTTTGNGAIAFTNGTANIGGASFNGAAGITINGGTANFNIAGTASALTFSSGTIGGSAGLTVNGPTTWTGGSLTSVLTIPATRTLSIPSG